MKQKKRNNMLNLLLLGIPGSGKSTHGQILAGKYGLFHLEAGEVIRKKIENNEPPAEELKSYLESEKLVPDEMINGIMAKIIQEEFEKGFVFDGYPRNVNQARFLDELLEKKGTKLHHIFLLSIPEETGVERIIQKRLKEQGRTTDQSEELVRKRMDVQKRLLKEVKDYYTQQRNNKPYEYEADSTVQSIQEAIDTIIARAKSSG